MPRASAPAPADAPPPRRPQRATPKLQRWVDLLAALLVHHYGIPFERLVEEVPAYAESLGGRPLDALTRAERAALDKKFERDKEDLRGFGVPLETIPGPDGEKPRYRVRPRDFYLPYLGLVAARGAPPGRAARLDAYGYRGLPELAFDADELAAVAAAAARVRTLGDPALAREAQGAVRKLAFDLPLDAAAAAAGDGVHVAAGTRAAPAVLATLGDAVLARRRVRLGYHGITRDRTDDRVVEPYGLFFLHGHWYLAARDPQAGDDAAALRNFRVDRVRAAVADAAARDDFVVPGWFRLAEHARSRQAWELGDGDAEEAVVEFRADTGVALPAARLGEALPDAPRRRRFRVRRRDAFVRWLLALAGDARPVSPPALVADYRAALAAARAVYADVPTADVPTADVPTVAGAVA